MPVGRDFIEAVDEGKLLRVKIDLKDSLTLDPSGRSFAELLDYAQARLPELLVAHDGEVFRPADQWDEGYYNSQMGKVVKNFSSQRIQLLREMSRALYGEKKDAGPSRQPSGSTQPSGHRPAVDRGKPKPSGSAPRPPLRKEFTAAVEQGRLTLVRIMLKDSLLLDPSGRSFAQMLYYAKPRLPALLVDHDGEVFKPVSEWGEDYLNEEMVKVVDNFSSQRLGLLCQMTRALYGGRGKEEGPSQTAGHGAPRRSSAAEGRRPAYGRGSLKDDFVARRPGEGGFFDLIWERIMNLLGLQITDPRKW